jgi:RNA polymerase sigma-70 factor (ECF subfamily)
MRYAVHLVHDADGASHIVQDAFIKGYINLNGFDTKKKFSSWIYRIVHNEAMNVIKKYQKESPLIDDIEGDEDTMRDYEQKETALQVETCLNALPLIYAEPLSLYYLDEKSYEEISDILRIPMGTVAIRMSRARKLMKHLCQKN